MSICLPVHEHSCACLYMCFLMGKRELISLLNLSSWCLVMVERLFLAVQRGCLQFVIVVFPDHTHLLFLCACMHVCVCMRERTYVLVPCADPVFRLSGLDPHPSL